jgi:hypothetical protein
MEIGTLTFSPNPNLLTNVTITANQSIVSTPITLTIIFTTSNSLDSNASILVKIAP